MMIDPGVRGYLSVVILAGATGLSGVVDIGGFRIVGIEMPAVWAVANLTFQAYSGAQAAFQNIYDDAGTEVTVTAAASRCIILRSDLALALLGYRLIKIRSGTSGVAVNQTTGPTLGLVLLPA